MMNPVSMTQRRHAAAWIAVAALAALGFVSLALLVVSGHAQPFDHWGLLALRDPANQALPYGPVWWQETVRDITALGSNGVLVILVLMGSGLLALGSGHKPALYLLGSSGGALALNGVVKRVVARPRPELVAHAVPTFTSSFPSSHATVSSAVLLAIVVLLFGVGSNGRFRLFAIIAATLLVALIGTSRVYLAVHWPTDIVAGWLLGCSWASLCAACLIKVGRG